MSGETFLHGTEVIEVDDGVRHIRTVRSAVIGVVGTAPNSAPEVKATLTVGQLTFTALAYGALGNDVSIQYVAGTTLAVAVVNKAITVTLGTASTSTAIAAAVTANTAAAALVSVAGSGTGVPTAMFRPALLTGGADEPFPLNTPVLIAGDQRKAAKLGATGTLPDAMTGIFAQTGAVVVVVRVEQANTDGEGSPPDEDLTMQNVIGGIGIDGKYNGVWAFLGAESVVGFCPRILIAPGFTSQRPSGLKNPVAAELESIVGRLRAVAIVDGSSTTDAAAIAGRRDFGNKRVFFHDVNYIVMKNGEPTTVPASSYIAGLIARIDNEQGFWNSPSNKEIYGIIGTERPIDFTLGDANSQANLLNENEVATTIRKDGFRLWGNRTTSIDPKWAFLSVVRTADMINDSLLRAHMWAVDRNITRTYFEDVAAGVNAYLARLKTMGAIAGGRCWADKSANPAVDIAAGRAVFDFDFSAYAPAERVTFRSHMVNDYLGEIL